MPKIKVVKNGDIELYTESFGRPKDQPLILIMGASGSSQLWEVDFCEELVGHNFFVIRYDNRDTGDFPWEE